MIGIAASLTLLIGSFAVVQARATSAWGRMVARSAQLRDRWDARMADSQREPLWGEATDGDAFMHYGQAADVLAAKREQRDRLRELLALDDDALVDALTTTHRDLRSTWRPALEHLHRGAHSRPCRRAGDDFAELDVANLLDYRALCNAAVMESRAARARGDHAAAVGLTLDAATLGSDLMRDGVLIDQMIGAALVAIVTEAWPDDALRALPAADRTALDRGLAQLDERLPRQLDMTRELLYFAEIVQRAPDQAGSCGDGTWNYGFSQRWMVADAFLMCDVGYEQLATPSDGGWPQRKQRFDAFVAAMVDSGNDVCAVMVPNLGSAEYTLLETLTRVRLLRAAIALHRGATEVTLRDPFAARPFTLADLDAGGIEVRSVGADEVPHDLRRVVHP